MEKVERHLTRKHKQLRVPVLPSEEKMIKKAAVSAGLPTAAYLRNVGLGYQIKSVLDNQRVEQLARINGDLGRLGGLLKLWLSNDPRTREFGKSTIFAVLSKIEDTQEQMHDIMRSVVTPKIER